MGHIALMARGPDVSMLLCSQSAERYSLVRLPRTRRRPRDFQRCSLVRDLQPTVETMAITLPQNVDLHRLTRHSAVGHVAGSCPANAHDSCVRMPDNCIRVRLAGACPLGARIAGGGAVNVASALMVASDCLRTRSHRQQCLPHTRSTRFYANF